MLFYGDQQERVCTAEVIEGLTRETERLLAVARVRIPPGWRCADSTCLVLVECGRLAQGLIDSVFRDRGCDELDPGHRAAIEITTLAARSRFGLEPWIALSMLRDCLARMCSQRLPAELELRVPEGYAFYGVYPECWAAAARSIVTDPSALCVIGLRSIGTSLGAAAAVACDAGALVTLRPTGHPFAREIRVGPELERVLLRPEHRTWAIVDEGPGMSGSSFGAVADWLEARGVPSRSMCFLPSHAGPPGEHASDRHRARWLDARRHSITFEQRFVEGPAPEIAGWFGAHPARIADLSGGRWRRHLPRGEADWPPADAALERRKYLLETGEGPVLAKFAGLGSIGERKLRRARALAEAGFGPPVHSLARGFLAQRWLRGSARTLHEAPSGRARVLDVLPAYLTFLARCMRAPAAQGASAEELFVMARHNTGEALGSTPVAALDRWSALLRDVDRAACKVAIDARMHPWEWLIGDDGSVTKTDALDHHAGHDLVGAQDIAWDVAGAAVELELSAAERDELLTRVGREVALHPELLDFYELAYLAFQLGAFTLAARRTEAAAEKRRLEARAGRYAERLRQRVVAERRTIEP